MKVSYNPEADDFFVLTPDGKVTLRTFYVEARRASSMSINELQKAAKLKHPTLYNVEQDYQSPYKSNSTRAILAALLTLGYTVDIELS